MILRCFQLHAVHAPWCAGTHDILRIHLTQTADDIKRVGVRTVLLPFVRDLVPVVDLAERRMEILPPEGLLDLAVRGGAPAVFGIWDPRLGVAFGMGIWATGAM